MLPESLLLEEREDWGCLETSGSIYQCNNRTLALYVYLWLFCIWYEVIAIINPNAIHTMAAPCMFTHVYRAAYDPAIESQPLLMFTGMQTLLGQIPHGWVEYARRPRPRCLSSSHWPMKTLNITFQMAVLWVTCRGNFRQPRALGRDIADKQVSIIL